MLRISRFLARILGKERIQPKMCQKKKELTASGGGGSPQAPPSVGKSLKQGNCSVQGWGGEGGEEGEEEEGREEGISGGRGSKVVKEDVYKLLGNHQRQPPKLRHSTVPSLVVLKDKPRRGP